MNIWFVYVVIGIEGWLLVLLGCLIIRTCFEPTPQPTHSKPKSVPSSQRPLPKPVRQPVNSKDKVVHWLDSDKAKSTLDPQLLRLMRSYIGTPINMVVAGQQEHAHITPSTVVNLHNEHKRANSVTQMNHHEGPPVPLYP